MKCYLEGLLFLHKVQSLVKLAKQNFFENKLDERKGSPKALWNMIKSLGHSKCSNSKFKIGLRIDDEVCLEEKTVAQTFNSFFTAVAFSLVDKLPSCTNQYYSQVVDDYYDRG